MKKSVCILVSLSSVAFSSVNIKSVDIYKNRVFVNQLLDISKSEEKLLNVVRLEDLRFINVDGTCSVNSSSIDFKRYKNDFLSIKIEKYKQKLAFLENEKNSIVGINNAISNIKFENEAVNLKNIKNVASYMKEQLYINSNRVFELENKKREVQIELNKLIQKRDSHKYSILKYDISCNSNSKIYVNYPIYNLSFNGFYEIKAYSENKNLYIKNLSFINQTSGYDFKNIDINFFTYNYTSQIFPKKFFPKYLDIYEQKHIQKQMDMVAYESAQIMKKSKEVRKPSFSYSETETKSFFRASSITLKSGVKTPIVFGKDKYKSNTEIEISGFANSIPFYKIEFESNKLFSSLNAKLYLDSVYIGQRYIDEIKKQQNNSLYFGEDRFIDVKKELIKDIKEKPFFSVNKIKTDKLWKYTIINKHKDKRNITLVERIPISKSEDIRVKLNSSIKYTKKEKNGKITYKFKLKPNEKKIINFGYEVEKPYKK